MQQDDDKKIILEKYKYMYLNSDIMLSKFIKNDGDNYYFDKFGDIDTIECFKDFLIEGEHVEDTSLYNYVEFIKNNKYFFSQYEEKINNLSERRNLIIFLRNVPTFTVWRILDYVRKTYNNDEKVLKTLDIYYNLERYMLSDVEWNSGYYLSNIDIECNYEKINMFPTTSIVVKKNDELIILNYPGNDYEEECNYLAINPGVDVKNDYIMSIEEKKNIKNELQKVLKN